MFEESTDAHGIVVFSEEILILSDQRIAIQGAATEIWLLANSARELGDPSILVPEQTFKMFAEHILELNGYLIIIGIDVVKFWAFKNLNPDADYTTEEIL